MSRPLRIEYPGAAYHVMSRGVGRQRIFDRDEDHEMFIEALADAAAGYRWQVLSYCLMPNHFHLYLRTPEANLSRAMQALLTAYAVRKNRRDRRSGHLFQGRFRCHLVDEDGFGNAVSRYIHLNPVRAKGMIRRPVAERRRMLRDYRWSSYGAILGLRMCPRWLERDGILRGHGVGGLKERQDKYARYVEQGLMTRVADPFESAAAQCILGTDEFIDRIRRLHLRLIEGRERRRELRQGVKLERWTDFAFLQAGIAKEYGCSPEELLARGQYNHEARQMLMYLAWKLCRGRYEMAELAERFQVTTGGLSASRQAFQKRMAETPSLARKIVHFEQLFGVKNESKL